MSDVLALRDHVLGLLRAEPRWAVYDGEPPARVPVDPDGRPGMYACLYFAVPSKDTLYRSVDESLAGVETVVFQVTVAAGSTSGALRAGEKAARVLDGAELTERSGRVRMDPTVPVLADRDVAPTRWYSPLTFRCNIG